MLQLFCRFVVASAIFLAAICWDSSIRASATNKLIGMAGSMLGTSLEPLEMVVDRRIIHKLLNIRGNSSYPLYNLLVTQQCSFSKRHL